MKDLGNALLSTQRALLGAVTPELRAVLINLDEEEKIFYIRFFYHGSVSQDLIELWDCAITEASAGIDPHYDLDEDVQRLDYPEKIPFQGCYAYLRKE